MEALLDLLHLLLPLRRQPVRGGSPAEQDVRARPTAGMHPEIVRGCQLEKLGVPLGIAAPKEQEAVAAAERLYVLGQFRSAELRRGGRGCGGGRRRGRRGLCHEPGLLRTGQIGLYGGKAAFKHGNASLAPAGLVEQRRHVFTDGEAGIEGKIARPSGPVQRDGGVFFLRRKTVKLRLEQAGGILCRNHVAEAFFFRSPA